MRKITEKAVSAFKRAEKFRMGNTEVEVLPNVTILKLHDNNIAYKYNNPENTLSISTCGFNSKTTKERLQKLVWLELSAAPTVSPPSSIRSSLTSMRRPLRKAATITFRVKAALVS